MKTPLVRFANMQTRDADFDISKWSELPYAGWLLLSQIESDIGCVACRWPQHGHELQVVVLASSRKEAVARLQNGKTLRGEQRPVPNTDNAVVAMAELLQRHLCAAAA